MRSPQRVWRPTWPALAVAVLIFAGSVWTVGWPLQVRVLTPRLGMPWIDGPSAQMALQIATGLPYLLPPMELSLEGSGYHSTLRPISRRWSGAKAVVTVSLPTLPDGAYALRVHTPYQDLIMPKAVFLRRNWPTVLHIAQIADLPPPGREPLMRQFLAAMHRRRPDAVLVTGDINYSGTESNIQFIFAQLALLEVPVIVAAGNHEREAWHRYLRVFGARDHRVNFGPLAIFSLDSSHGSDALTPSTFRWLASELQHLDGRVPLIQLHHPIFPLGPSASSEASGSGGYLRGYRRALIELCEKYQVAAVLSGHWHQDAVFDQHGTLRADRSDFAGTKYIVTTALGADARKLFDDSPVRNGYRWLEFVNGQLSSYSPDPRHPIPSTPLDDQAVNPP